VRLAQSGRAPRPNTGRSSVQILDRTRVAVGAGEPRRSVKPLSVRAVEVRILRYARTDQQEMHTNAPADHASCSLQRLDEESPSALPGSIRVHPPAASGAIRDQVGLQSLPAGFDTSAPCERVGTMAGPTAERPGSMQPDSGKVGPRGWWASIAGKAARGGQRDTGSTPVSSTEDLRRAVIVV
jgi:hypothetical protein